MAESNQDISSILKNWDYHPESNVRKIVGEDGAQKLQVRVDQGAFQGILQLNLDGRPDGSRPHDAEFVLDHYCESAKAHEARNKGKEEGFELDRPSCQELFDESARVYGRYVFLLQLKEYDRVIRDTERNMKLFEFVHTYASHEDDRQNLQKWWPYILRIHATARAMLAFEEKRFDESVEILGEAKEKIEDLTEVDAEEFEVEKERSGRALDELAEELRNRKPLSRREQMQKDLEEAVAEENFEKAAEVRDKLRDLPLGLDG
jgi:tetratricopeptide (TPR) repeat protein